MVFCHWNWCTTTASIAGEGSAGGAREGGAFDSCPKFAAGVGVNNCRFHALNVNSKSRNVANFISKNFEISQICLALSIDLLGEIPVTNK